MKKNIIYLLFILILAFPASPSDENLLELEISVIEGLDEELKTLGVIGLSLNESYVAAFLNHSNLCTIWDIHPDDNEDFYCQGSSLCCDFLDIEQSSDRWDRDIYYHSNYSGIFQNNTLLARLVYVDYNLEYDDLYSEVYYSEEKKYALYFIEDMGFFQEFKPEYTGIEMEALQLRLYFSLMAKEGILKYYRMMDSVVYKATLFERMLASVYGNLPIRYYLSADGILGLWDFGEGVSDLSLNGNDGFLEGNLTCEDKHLGCRFEGYEGYIGFDTNFNISREFSIEAWIYPQSPPQGNGRVVVSTYDWDKLPSNERGWFMGDDYGSADRFRFKVYDNNGDYAYAVNKGFFHQNMNKITHVMGVFSPGQYLRLYVNGEKVAEDVVGIPLQIANKEGINMRVGARSDNGRQGNWHGDIRMIALYNRSLNDDEIMEHYVIGDRLL